MPRCFIDTNIAVYAIDRHDPSKRTKAKDLITDLLNRGEAVVSSQVLVEFANIALSKLGLASAGVIEQVRALADAEVIAISEHLVCAAIAARDEYQLSFWDACIIAAAQQAGCEVLYTEDLNSGQKYGTVLAVDPFNEERRPPPPR